jgi:carbohydrate-selective porin OprB
VLVNGVTYYASQTSNGYESPDRLAVTVEVTLTTNSFDFTNLTYGPNPVENILNISSDDIFQKVNVYNYLGQAVLQQSYTTSDLKLDLGSLTKGNYFVKLESESKQEVIKILKN